MPKHIKLFLLIFGCCLLACNVSNKQNLQIDFSSDSSKVIISNISASGLYHLRTNLATDSTYQQLVWVLQTPTGDDSTSMEIDWPGDLRLSGSQLIFTPRQPFVKGKTYLVETMLDAKFASKKDILKSEVGHKVRATQQVLVR